MLSIFDFRPHGQDPVSRNIFRIGLLVCCLMSMNTCVSPAKAEASVSYSFDGGRQHRPHRHTPLSDAPKSYALVPRRSDIRPRTAAR